MKKILSILIISLAVLSSYAQTEAGFLKDAKNNFVKVGTSSTEFQWSAFPPDTIIDFSVNVGGADEPFTSLLTEIRSYYTLEEAAGNAIDSVGTADLPLVGSGITQDVAGLIDQCYSFTGSGYLGWIDSYFEFTGSFTLSIWAKTSSTGSNKGLIANQSSANYGYEILMNSGGASAALVQTSIRGAWGTVTSNGTTPINDNAWHHVVSSYNAIDDTLKIYVDGVLEDKDYSVNGPSYDDICRFTVGSRYSIWMWNGLLDEPATWNKELTQTEVDSLFAMGQYPFLGEGSGGDSLELTTLGYDPRIDSVIINWNYEGDGWPTDEEDGTIKFAFPVTDTTLYHDSIFPWPGLKDTIILWAAWSGINDVWTVIPNKYNMLIDSSDLFPPEQDIGIWDTIFWQDFEQHAGIAPVEYVYSLQSPDWNNHTWFDTDHQYPGWWATTTTTDDSIVIDIQTGSAVLRESFEDTIADGYTGTGPARGGDSWTMLLPESGHTELYVSYNIMFRPGFVFAAGGKTGGGFSTYYLQQECPPPYGQGFSCDIGWMNYYYGFHGGELNMYASYPTMTSCPNRTLMFWNDFTPVGEGLNYYDNTEGYGLYVYLDVTDSTWYNLTMRCVVNTFTGTTPNADGIIEGFLNGYLIERWTGLQLLTYPIKDLGIQNLYFRCFYGGGPKPERDEWILIDDIYIFTYDVSVDVPRGNELSPEGRVLSLPNWPKE